MEQIQSERPGRKFLALAFLLPFLGYSLVMLAGRFSPFGSSSILYSDMYHQYYPFFVEFRRVLRSVARWSITGIWAWGWTTWGSLPTILPLP